MAPIPPTIEPAFYTRNILDPAVNEISTFLHRLGIVHDHPDFGDGDIPGEGGPGGIGDGGLIGDPTDAQRSGILMVLMMFGIMAVMFTIVTGWIWCVAAREPAYYTVREGRKVQSKTRKVVPFKEWYRNHRNLPRNKSDLSREEDYLRVLAFLSARDWRGCVLPNGEPVDYSHEHWEKFWREHGHKGLTAASGPRSPLMSERGRAYNTFSKEGETGLEIPHVDDIEGVLYSTAPLAIPVPPLRRPPSKSTKGRTAPSSGGSTSPEDEKRRHREQRSHSSSGGSGGRPWKCGRRDPSDLSDSGWRPSRGGSGRGSSRNYRSSRGRAGMGYKGLDVVVEEAFPATEK